MGVDEWTAIGALSAVVGIIVAIIFQILEWRRQRFSRSVDIVAQMDARWESVEFREIRKQAASFLLSPQESNQAAGEESVRTVLNFFETVGFLVRKRVVDEEAVWHFFGSWLFPYFRASDRIMEQSCSLDPNCYSDFKILYGKLRRVEAKQHPTQSASHLDNRAAVTQCLKREAQLKLNTIPSTTPV